MCGCGLDSPVSISNGQFTGNNRDRVTLNETKGCNQQNPDCGKSYRINNLVSSAENDKQRKRKRLGGILYMERHESATWSNDNA